MSEDLIKRSDAIKALHKHFSSGFDCDRWWNSTTVLFALNSVPSADRPSAVDLSSVYSTAYKSGYEKGKADRPQGEWIPCSERLPDDDDRVLTYDTDGDINIMWFDGRDEDGKDVWKDDYSIEWCDIVAWQPLPEPWKGADDER